jgi:hypothetical protein
VVGYKKGNDTLCNFSIFQTTYVHPDGLIPYGDYTPTTDMGDYDVFETGPIVTHDSLVVIEKVWYAPKTGGDSCSFVIECIKVYVNSDYKDTIVTGVRIGEAIDFDIPTDSGSENQSGFDATLRLIYQQGKDFNATANPCNNDMRFGGIDFLGAYKGADTLWDSIPHAAYTKDNATYVYPEGTFVPEVLYKNFTTGGYSIFTSANPDSQYVDLHTAMVCDTGLTLSPGKFYKYYLSICTHWNGNLASFKAEVQRQREWYKRHIKPVPLSCCINRRGNVNNDGADACNVADLTYLVDFLFRGGLPPVCLPEANVNGDGAGAVNVADLTYLVDFLFRGGALPPLCP